VEKAMPQTDRQLVIKWLNEAWTTGLWAASWSKAIDSLTPSQAAWAPAPDRHSIWQLVLHMAFWREVAMRRAMTGQQPKDEEVKSGNFPTLSDRSEKAWADAKQRFAASQRKLTEMLETGGLEADPLMNFLAHDSYHFGQINYLRGLQGLPSVE
jgi:hypothetical protein